MEINDLERGKNTISKIVDGNGVNRMCEKNTVGKMTIVTIKLS